MIPFGQKFEFQKAREMFGMNKLELPWIIDDMASTDPETWRAGMLPAMGRGHLADEIVNAIMDSTDPRVCVRLRGPQSSRGSDTGHGPRV